MTHLAPMAFAQPAPVKAPDHPPMQRLRRAGLRPEEEQFIREAWDGLGPGERLEWYESVMGDLDQDELRRQIEELRSTGWSEAMVGETPAAGGVPDGNVDEILAWVGNDAERARAALVVEPERHDPPRKTLVEPLEDLLGG